MNWFLEFLGFYREDNKLKYDLREGYAILSMIVLVRLALDTIPTLVRDDWGYDSFYMHKLSIIAIIFLGVYWVWGYLRLVKRVTKLEEKK